MHYDFLIGSIVVSCIAMGFNRMGSAYSKGLNRWFPERGLLLISYFFTFYCLLLLFTFADGYWAVHTARGLTGGFPGVAPQLSSDRSSSSSSRLAKAARAQCCADHHPGRT